MAVEIKQLVSKVGNTCHQLTRGYPFDITSNDSSIITKIVYCRKGYNKGYQGDFPSYKVEFEDPQFKLIIPEKNIESIIVESIEKDKKKSTPDFLPELPTEELPTEEQPIGTLMDDVMNEDFLIKDELPSKMDPQINMHSQTNND